MKLIQLLLIACSTVLFVYQPAFAATIQDEVSAVNMYGEEPMRNKDVDLQSVQEAFTDSGPMENMLTVRYKKGKVTKVYVREFMDTHIILPENIAGYSLGDESNFHWVPGGNKYRYRGRIFFDNYNADTNLTLFGESGAVYAFYIRAISHSSDFLPHLVVFVENPKVKHEVQETPIESEHKKKVSKKRRSHGVKMQRQADGEYLRSLSDVDVTNLNYNYEIVGGKQEIAPIMVFDDGVWTYFKFADENFDEVARLPVVYKVVDGYDNPLNTRKFKGTIIAEGKATGWTLRHGESHVCIRKVK